MPNYELSSPNSPSCGPLSPTSSQLRKFGNTPYCSSNDLKITCNQCILLPLPTPLKTPSPQPSPIFDQILSPKSSYKIHTILLEAKGPEAESHILAFHNQRLEGLKKVQRKDGLGVRYGMNITGKSRRRVRSMIEVKTNTMMK